MNQDQQQMRDLVGRYVEAFNQQDVDALDAILAPAFVDHNPLLNGLPAGCEGHKTFAKQVLEALPNLSGNIQDQVIEGNVVISSIAWTCTQPRSSSSIGTFRITPTHMMRTANGRIVEQWTGFDRLGMLRQLGSQMDGSPKQSREALV